jgi:hypothetical protein
MLNDIIIKAKNSKSLRWLFSAISGVTDMLLNASKKAALKKNPTK